MPEYYRVEGDPLPVDEVNLSSGQVLAGWLPAEHSTLPQTRDVAAEWLLGVPASGLERL